MLNPLELTGRTILVTGASSGIGRETAILLSRLGGRVILCARDRSRLEEACGCLEGSGHVTEACDLRSYETIPTWMRQMADAYGQLDGLVHSAGLHMVAPLKAMEATPVEALWTTNVTAGLWLAKGFRHPRVSRPASSVVFMSSVVGLVGQPAVAAYSASKAAIVGLTRSLALELAPQGIRVNCIAPGYVATRMSAGLRDGLTVEQYDGIKREHPLGMGEAIDVANAAAFLLSPAARWITGSVMVVDGGYTAH